MGVFEMDAFAKGTNAIATTLADLTGKVSTSHTCKQTNMHTIEILSTAITLFPSSFSFIHMIITSHLPRAASPSLVVVTPSLP